MQVLLCLLSVTTRKRHALMVRLIIKVLKDQLLCVNTQFLLLLLFPIRLSPPPLLWMQQRNWNIWIFPRFCVEKKKLRFKFTENIFPFPPPWGKAGMGGGYYLQDL